MAFIGVFALAWVAFMIFLIIVGTFFFVFLPALIVAIINLVKGIRNHWPKINIILLIVFGTIALTFIVLASSLGLLILLARLTSPAESENTACVVNQIINIYYLAKGCLFI